MGIAVDSKFWSIAEFPDVTIAESIMTSIHSRCLHLMKLDYLNLSRSDCPNDFSPISLAQFSAYILHFSLSLSLSLCFMGEATALKTYKPHPSHARRIVSFGTVTLMYLPCSLSRSNDE